MSPPATERASRDPIHGRGAVDNPTGRFEHQKVLPFDDGWGGLDALLNDAHRPATTVMPELTRRIISTNESPDVPFDRSINPYKGCEHGCIYCYARPTHAYLNLSPGLDFETKIFSKPDAARLLRQELRRPGYVPDVLVLGGNTDPYQPAERELGITRSVLEVLQEHRHPLGIITKSAGVLRDLDILSEMGRAGLARVFLSVTTLDPELARTMEPRAAAPARRLRALAELSAAGVPVGVMAAPIVPGINDKELEAILEAAAAAGARTAGYVLLRLPLEIKDLFEGWLAAHFPHRRKHVLELIRQTRGGQLYQSDFSTRQRGTGAWAELLERRFELALRRLGLQTEAEPLVTSQFRVPPEDTRQLALFGGRSA
jgi:DNA repair photolyase